MDTLIATCEKPDFVLNLSWNIESGIDNLNKNWNVCILYVCIKICMRVFVCYMRMYSRSSGFINYLDSTHEIRHGADNEKQIIGLKFF